MYLHGEPFIKCPLQEQSSRREAYHLEGVSSESQVQENVQMMKAKVSLRLYDVVAVRVEALGQAICIVLTGL